MISKNVLKTDAIRPLLRNRIQNGRGGFAAYLMLGYPDYETSVEAMIAVAKEGADIIEIGIPFSDPIADGPVIQHAGTIAIANGVHPADTWAAARTIRKRTKALPVVMTYANIPMQYGFARFAHDACQAGVRGIILPDVPPELFPEELLVLNPIFLASPLTIPNRLELLVNKTHGFLYIMSNLGITGEQRFYDPRIRYIVNHVNQMDSNLPKLLGFGVHDFKSAQNALACGMDGVIVGSALIQALGDGGDISLLSNVVRDIIRGLKKRPKLILES
ncbi:MAG: tryptophan synthase subunit alpha [Candidatus Hodarchaeota archaeon]